MTPRRARRIRDVLDRRQPDLRVVTDYVHKAHNLSAIVRSCDAFGVLWMHALVGADDDHELFRNTAMGSERWVEVLAHAAIEDALAPLQRSGYQVVAAQTGEHARDYREVDYTRPTAFLMGAEKQGVQPAGQRLADVPVAIPMVGMVESFNVSVATAVLLAEAFRQREAAGLYARRRLDTALWRELFFEWGEPRLAALCRRHDLSYPAIDYDTGALLDPRWAARVHAAYGGSC